MLPNKEKVTPPSSKVTYKNKYNNTCYYNTNTLKNQAKNELPSPAKILAILGISVPQHTNSKGFFVIKCLFHDDNEPSLNIHSKEGYFNCFSCGAKGSLITFYMKATGKLCKDAIRSLQEWRA